MITTKDLAGQLGMTIGAFQQLIFRGVVKPPVQRIGPAYVWTDSEVKAAKKAVGELPRKRKQRQRVAAN
jgi:hypothetical protein